MGTMLSCRRLVEDRVFQGTVFVPKLCLEMRDFSYSGDVLLNGILKPVKETSDPRTGLESESLCWRQPARDQQSSDFLRTPHLPTETSASDALLSRILVQMLLLRWAEAVHGNLLSLPTCPDCFPSELENHTRAHLSGLSSVLGPKQKRLACGAAHIPWSALLGLVARQDDEEGSREWAIEVT